MSNSQIVFRHALIYYCYFIFIKWLNDSLPIESKLYHNRLDGPCESRAPDLSDADDTKTI